MIRQTLLLFIAMVLTFQIKSQRIPADQIATDKGPLNLQPILHGSVVLTWDNKTIYIDPYGGIEAYNGIASPDIILITDIHGDHMDLKTLESIDISKAKLVVPQAVADKLPEKYKSKVVVMNNGDKNDQAGV